MDNVKYAEIRTGKEFLFEYYLLEGGIVKDLQNFNQFLSVWLSQFNMHPIGGKSQIVNYLDKKFGYVIKDS